MVKKGSKAKATEVDEEQALLFIDNEAFLKMRVMQRAWPAPATTAADLEELVEHGLLWEQPLSGYALPGEHLIPTPSPDQAILFVAFVAAGLCFPPSDFLLEFLQFFGLQLYHLSPNGILYLSTFMHLCEVYIGVPPNLHLFQHFFHLKLDPKSAPYGCCTI